ncbi:hypothetical protein LTS10_012830 [Elasticomyces elasticus]|nr:hypothetical protein LTS10_012830 [Elasticomyces elasticus]
MAEVFGVAAGAVGIASFAIQLADSIKKLQSFAAKLKNARVELDEILVNLEISLQWLDSIKNAASLAVALSTCSGQIMEIANELDTSMHTKRRRTAVKLAWGTEEMDRLRQKLETSKADLHRAHSIYHFEEMRFRVSEQGRLGRDLAMDLDAGSYVRDEILKDNIANLQAGQAMLQQTINAEQQGLQQSFAHMQTTQMYLRQELQVSHQVQQIGIGRLQTDQTTLQRALQAGQAQLGQEVRSGTTLITSHLDTSLAILSTGLLNAIQAQSAPTSTSPVVSTDPPNSSQSPKVLGEDSQNTLTQLWAVSRERHSLQEQGALLRTWFDTPGFTTDIAADIVEMLAKQPCTWSTEERLQLMLWMSGVDGSAIMFFDTVASFDLTSPALLQVPGSFTMLHALAKASSAANRNTKDDFVRLVELMRSFLLSGADLHLVWSDLSGHSYTPLTYLLDESSLEHPARSFSDLEDVIQSWVWILHTAGVNLEHYGRAEMDALRRFRRNNHRIHATLLSYGPNIDDWRLLELHPGDCYSGVFWHMIEHPEYSIPGAWLGEDDPDVKFEDYFVQDWAEEKKWQKIDGAQRHADLHLGLDA